MDCTVENAFDDDEKRLSIKVFVIMNMGCTNLIHDLIVRHGRHAQLILDGFLCGNLRHLVACHNLVAFKG